MKVPLTLAQARAFYAEEVRLVSGCVSREIEEAFAHVPREDFLPPPPWRFRPGRSPEFQTSDPIQLYHNVLVALDSKRNNGQPSLWYRHFEALELAHGDHVLHVGSGTGYYSAILSYLVGASGKVVAVEVDPDLARQARSNLAGLENVEFLECDATTVHRVVDAIVVSAGVAQPPRQWLEMLRVGGRIVIPITGVQGQGASFLLTKEAGGMSARFLTPVAFSHCDGTRDEAAANAVDEAARAGYQSLARVTKVRLDAHKRSESCGLHLPSMCLSI